MNEEKFMRTAISEARRAFDRGEVPVGAVVVKNGEIIARGYNLVEENKDPTAHAEMIALRAAARKLGGWRLIGCDLYVTCEPCAMCVGAMVWSRIEHLYFGAEDPKAGACGSVFDIPGETRLNHSIEVFGGVLEDECAALLRDFFARLRTKK